MNEKRILIAVGALAAALAACSSDPPAASSRAGGTGSGASGGSGSTEGSGGGGGSAGGGDPSVCSPGIPPTSQVPRLLNREYDAVVYDLLGVTTVASAGNAKPSTQLVPDFEGSLTDIAWNAYLVLAKSIAAEVMAGPNKAKFISCDPAAAGCFDSTIRAFGRKAFRRPLTEEEVARFMTLTTLQPAGTPDEIATAILYAFLASPSFIMLPELAQDQEGGAIKLSHHEVATRLSMLLWGSIPDDTLNAAADAGLLGTKEQILEQAKRMVQDRTKTAPVIKTFHRAYADIREGSHWGMVDHDPAKFPAFSTAAVAPMMAEMDAFFEEVAFTGGKFQDLFLSNIGFVNNVTAPLYGLDPAAYTADLAKVDFTGSRPGFLTRAAFLSSYSSYSATSPILRGAFVTTRVLGLVLGQPPPGATETPIPPGVYATQREAITALTSPQTCAGCHGTYVNPPGFVLEAFDSIGKAQTVDPLGGAINATADVYFDETTYKTITTPLELMNELAVAPSAQRHYAEAWVAFATGRSPNSNDACVVDQLNQSLSTDGYTIISLLTDLSQADSFRLRTVGN